MLARLLPCRNNGMLSVCIKYLEFFPCFSVAEKIDITKNEFRGTNLCDSKIFKVIQNLISIV